MVASKIHKVFLSSIRLVVSGVDDDDGYCCSVFPFGGFSGLGFYVKYTH